MELKDFTLGRELGKGAFGRVVEGLVGNKVYAVKIQEKSKDSLTQDAIIQVDKKPD